jgi:hypothetical protein
MPLYILPENVARENGAGDIITLESGRGKPLLLTLGITRTTEQERLEMSVWGSPDRDRWRLLETFPQKFYCGTYSLGLDLTRHPDVRYLRAEWKMSRWGGGEAAPLFGFYLVMETGKLQAACA